MYGYLSEIIGLECCDAEMPDCYDSLCSSDPVTDPCPCDEVEHCDICHPNGCDGCEDGYFKQNYNYHCIHCQETFNW